MGLGTMTWGVDTDEDEAANQLTAFVDAGGTLVDTADVYADGEGERVLGRLLRATVSRRDVVLATKAVARRDDSPPWTTRSAASAWTTSTCGSCTPGTPRCPSRRHSARWTRP